MPAKLHACKDRKRNNTLKIDTCENTAQLYRQHLYVSTDADLFDFGEEYNGTNSHIYAFIAGGMELPAKYKTKNKLQSWMSKSVMYQKKKKKKNSGTCSVEIHPYISCYSEASKIAGSATATNDHNITTIPSLHILDNQETNQHLGTKKVKKTCMP